MLTLGSRRITSSTRCARCGRTDAASQMTKRAGTRADPRAGLAGRAGPGGPAVRKAQTVPRTGCVPAHLLAVSYSPRHWPARSLAETVVHLVRRTSRWCPQGRAWAAAGRACEATRSAGLGARARTRALRELTRCRCLTTTSVASGGSSATGPRGRAPQCSRCTHRPPHRSARRLPRPGLARTDSRTATLPTLKVRNGPQAEARFMRRGSRVVRWSN